MHKPKPAFKSVDTPDGATRRVLIVASNNRHKIEELSQLLGAAWDVRPAASLDPEISWIESGTTFLENARIKASVVRRKTAHAVLADDSGLMVDALHGAPGVQSSSFGGVEGDHARNTQRLMREMAEVPSGKRGAAFQCTLVFLDETGREMVFTGTCAGEILQAAAGNGGFGYDPVFGIRTAGGLRALAELSAEEKSSVSHRGEATRKFIAAVTSTTEDAPRPQP